MWLRLWLRLCLKFFPTVASCGSVCEPVVEVKEDQTV